MTSSEKFIANNTAVQEMIGLENIAEKIDEIRIKLESFRGQKFYDDAEIDRDLERCKNLKEIFESKNASKSEVEREQYERGLVAEYTFRQALAEYGWLAKKIKVIVTSEFDDFVGGIDSVAQIETGPGRFEHLGLAIDFAASMNDVGEKLRRTFDSLDLGFSSSVKYFDSEKTGKLKNLKMPRIIIGAGHESMERLITYSSEMMSGQEISDSVKKEISEDPFRYILFGEIEAQLIVFIARLEKVVAEAIKQNRPDIEKRATSSLDIHRDSLKTIQRLAEESNLDMNTLRRHIKGDSFATKMHSALNLLSFTPIDFDRQQYSHR
jgi:hypothetical protein